jgi:hypothetical protein
MVSLTQLGFTHNPIRNHRASSYGKADELPEPPNLGLGKDEVLTTDFPLNLGLGTEISSVSVYRSTHFNQALKMNP